MTYRSTLLARGDIKWYFELDETSGTVAADDAGAGADGTYSGGFTLNQTPGPLVDEAGGWVLLNGSTGFVQAADHADRDLADTLSLIVWFQRTASGGSTEQILVSKGNNAYAITMNMGGVSNKLGVAKQGIAAIVVSTVDIADTNVHMFVWTKATTTNKLYLDGVDVTGTVTNQTLSDTAVDLFLGELSNGSLRFNGKLGRMSGHNAVISAADILALYELATVTVKVGSDTGSGADAATGSTADVAATDAAAGAESATVGTGSTSASVLTSGSSTTTSASSYATASITPTANRLVLLAVHQRSATTPAVPSGATGCGLTWVEVASVAHDLSGEQGRMTLYRAMGAAPSAGAVTISWGDSNQVGAIWAVSEFAGLDTGGTNGSAAVVQSATGVNTVGGGTAMLATLAAIADPGNPTYGVFAFNGGASAIPGSGFTELTDASIPSGTADAGLETEWRTEADTSVDATVNIASKWGAIALELAAAVGVDNQAKAGADTGTGADAATTGTAVLTALETAAAADAPTIFERPLADAGSGLDEALAVDQEGSAALLATETGTATETAATEAILSAAETGAGTEATTIRAIVVDDAATGVDVGSLEVLLAAAADTGVGADIFTGLDLGGALNYAEEVEVDLPTIYLRLGEAAGAFVDTMVANDGTALGSPVRDVPNTALAADDGGVRFPTVSDRIEIADASDADLGDGPFTLECWAYRATDTAGTETILHKGAGGYGMGISTLDNLILYKSGTGILFRSSVTIAADSAWHHFVITRNGTGAGSTKIYVDGVEGQVAVDPVTALVDTALPVEIGREGAGQRWTGGLDELALYKSVLSPTRVVAHYGARGNVGNRTITAIYDATPFIEDYTEVASDGPDDIGTGVDAVIGLTQEAVEVILSLFASDEGAGAESSLVTAFSVAAIGRPVEYVIELFDSSGTFGPGTRIGEVWDARNLGWSAYDRLPGKAFFTLFQRSPHLALMAPLTTHVKVWRLSSNATVNVYSGEFIDYDAGGDDVVLNCFDYLALLSISRTGYKVLYPVKTLKEIVDAEWALAKAALSSPLAFLTSGTTETPLGTDGATAISTNNQFGLLDQMRLQLFFDLSEMGRANTANQVTYGISRTAPHTFTFKKNAGSDIGLGLVLGGNVSDYRHLPNWSSYRNDLATIGTTVGGGATELVVKDDVAAAAKGRRQDVFTIKTVLGIIGKATEADSQKAAAERMLRSAVSQGPTIMLRLLRGAVEPFVGWELNDRPIVEIENGMDSIATPWRIVGVRGIVTEAGEDLSLIVEPVLT